MPISNDEFMALLGAMEKEANEKKFLREANSQVRIWTYLKPGVHKGRIIFDNGTPRRLYRDVGYHQPIRNSFCLCPNWIARNDPAQRDIVPACKICDLRKMYPDLKDILRLNISSIVLFWLHASTAVDEKYFKPGKLYALIGKGVLGESVDRMRKNYSNSTKMRDILRMTTDPEQEGEMMQLTIEPGSQGKSSVANIDFIRDELAIPYDTDEFKSRYQDLSTVFIDAKWDQAAYERLVAKVEEEIAKLMSESSSSPGDNGEIPTTDSETETPEVHVPGVPLSEALKKTSSSTANSGTSTIELPVLQLEKPEDIEELPEHCPGWGSYHEDRLHPETNDLLCLYCDFSLDCQAAQREQR